MLQLPALLAGVALCLGSSRSFAVDLIGYVPSYRMSDSNYVNNTLPGQLAMLDEVRYFGITATSTGGLTTTSSNLAQIQAIQNKINALPVGQRPRLGITIGGAFNGRPEDNPFFPIAGNPALQDALAVNVRNLLVDAGAAGVDVDWEHPADGVQLTTQYPAMLSRIKQEVGSTRRVYATVEPARILPRSVFEGADAIDGVSLMTYDIGWWANDSADPNLGQHSLPQYVTDSVNAWTNPAGSSIPRTYVFGSKKSVNAPESKLGVGDPFYGRGYNGSSTGLAVAYRDLKASGTTADGNAYVYQGSNVWLPGPALVADRIEFAHDRGLQHVIFWEMWHDLAPTSRNRCCAPPTTRKCDLAAADGDFNADGSVDAADFEAWRQGFGIAVGATPSAGDANGDGTVDASDLLQWQRRLQGPPLNGLLIAPEPTPAFLWVCVCALLIRRRRFYEPGRRTPQLC